MRAHLKQTETVRYKFFTCHPLGAKKGFVKGQAVRFLETNSSNKTFEENITTFKKIPYAEMLPTKPSSNKTKQKINLALCNTIPPSCSKSDRNPNGEVIATNTAPTIAKTNFQGTHNIIQNRAFTHRHNRT